MWTQRAAPKPLHLAELLPEGPEAAVRPVGPTQPSGTSVCKALGLSNPNEVSVYARGAERESTSMPWRVSARLCWGG